MILKMGSIRADMDHEALMIESTAAEAEIITGDVELISRVSHELCTPLTSVIGLLDVILDPALPLDDVERAELLTLENATSWPSTRTASGRRPSRKHRISSKFRSPTTPR